MRNLRAFIAVAVFIATMTAIATNSRGEEEHSRFSLGHWNLVAPSADARTPAPGVVTAKYGFMLARDFIPYLGTGLAYSFQQEVRQGDSQAKFKTGVAGQAGFSYLLGNNSSLNFDYKYFSITPDGMRGESGSPPQSLGVDLHIRF